MTASPLDKSIDPSVAGASGEAQPGASEAEGGTRTEGRPETQPGAQPAAVGTAATDAEDDADPAGDPTDAADAPDDAGSDGNGSDGNGSDRAGSDRAGSDRAGSDRAGSDEADEEELFRQSEIAADYVEGLLDVLDMDGDIDELIANGRPVVEVVGGRLQSLVGPRGATLEALQDLARLAVFRRTGAPSRLLLDIGGYRATRRNELAAVARNAIERVREHGEPVRLEPMSAFERKCVHDVINATEGVMSESQGEEPNRRIMVRPE